MMELFQHESFGITGRPSVIALILLATTILGVLCYIRAFFLQSHKLTGFGEFFCLSCTCQESKLRGVQNVYGSLFSFLFSDVLNATFAIVYAVLLLQNSCGDSLGCAIVSNMWLAFRYFSLGEHLVTALISITFLCHPSTGTALRYISRFLIGLFYVFVILWFRVSDIFLLVLNAYKCLLIVAIVWFNFYPLSAHAASQRRDITFTALSTFLCICLPNFVIDCFLLKSWSEGLQDNFYYVNISINILYATNVHIFMDGLLCYFVLKLEEDVEQPEREGNVGAI